MSSVIFILGAGVGGVAAAAQHRYWRVSFTTALGASGDYRVGQIQLYQDLNRADLGLRADISQSGGINGADIVSWKGVSRNASNGHVESYFDGTYGTSPYNHDYDFGAGNEAYVHAVEVSAGSDASEIPRDFEVYYSDDGISYTLAWSSGATTAYTAYQKKQYISGSAPGGGTAIDEAGILVENAAAFAVIGKRPDGPTVEDNTTYAVVTP